MNARQKAKKQKKEIKNLKSDNDLIRRIIADVPAMQELYDAYNKPVYVTHTTMQFQEFRAKRTLPENMMYIDRFVKYEKQAVLDDLFEEIKGSITCEVNTECMPPTITASIFIGIEE